MPGVGRQVVAVVGRHAVAAQRFGQPGYALPVQLQARADDQLFVLHDPTTVQDHRIAFGLESGQRRLDPAHAVRQHRGHGARGGARGKDTGADQRPAGLVVVDIGRVDDGDVQARAARQQAGRHRDAGGAAADDHHLVRGVGHFDGRLAAVDDAAHHALQVEAGLGRAFDDLRQRQTGRRGARLRQRPHRGRAHAGAAEGQHRLGQLGHQRAKGQALFVADLARLGGQVAGLQALVARGALDFFENRLVGAFAIGPVADDRTEAGLAQGFQVGSDELRRHRQLGAQGVDVHAMCLLGLGVQPGPLRWRPCAARWRGEALLEALCAALAVKPR